MATELPRYLIRHPTYIEGVGCVAREGPDEFDISEDVATPRNSWEPVNEAAKQAFKRRNEAVLANSQAQMDALKAQIEEAKEQGAKDEELVHIHDELADLRAQHIRLPRKLNAVPTFAPKQKQRAYSEPPAVDRKPTVPAVVDHEKVERLVNAARSGGASEADIKVLKASLGVTEPVKAEKPEKAAPKPEEKQKPAPKGQRASDQE